MSSASEMSQPPVAPKICTRSEIHGDTRFDDYSYLKEKSNPEVIAYLEAENRYADAAMEPTQGFQETLYQEILGRIQETDLSVPYLEGSYWHYSKTEAGKQYPILCRKRGTQIAITQTAIEEVVLDLNELAVGHSFLSLGAYEISDDGNFLAYSADFTGFREYTLHVKDLRSGKLLADAIPKVGSVSWAEGNSILFYTTEDEAKRSFKIFRHTVGAAFFLNDELVYEEPDALYSAELSRSRDRKFLFLSSHSTTTSEYSYIRASSPLDQPTLIFGRLVDHEYHLDHRGGLFVIRTNQNAVNFKLMSAQVNDPGHWTQVVAEDPKRVLEDHDLFEDYTVLTELEEGLPLLRVLGPDGLDYRIEFPEPAYSVSGDQNREFKSRTFRYRYQSMITPMSVMEQDLAGRTSKLLKETPVLGGYDRSQYTCLRVHAEAADGTKIPISMVHRKGIPRDCSAPLMLYGYGAYGLALPVGMSLARLSLLDRGVVYAQAHIRGGGELGKPWHDGGRLGNKMNTFTDFISCADYLVAEKFTSPERMVIQGGSAGGLLVGAVVNLRPDLCKAALMQVPFVDVINTMLDESLPLTVGEYLEWGNPKIEDDYHAMKAYCPYSNLKACDYPALLIKTSLHDSQVMYWEPAKYTARLRTLKTDRQPLLLKTNMEAGHGGSSGRYDALREVALDYAFVLTQLGIFA